MTFSIDILVNKIINEDIEFNLPPEPTRNLKFPCSVCSNSVMSNQKSVQCDTCDLWAHTKCCGTSNEEYEKLKEQGVSGPSWHCLLCTIRSYYEIFPFPIQ